MIVESLLSASLLPVNEILKSAEIIIGFFVLLIGIITYIVKLKFKTDQNSDDIDDVKEKFPTITNKQHDLEKRISAQRENINNVQNILEDIKDELRANREERREMIRFLHEEGSEWRNVVNRVLERLEVMDTTRKELFEEINEKSSNNE